jgi:methylmalonyl-CoA mutase N-terminal domain/subunit
MDEQLDLKLLAVDPDIEKDQVERLARLRAERDQAQVERLSARLKKAAESTENLMPLFIECVENDLTLGEITGALREVWGEYRPAGW